MIMIFWFQCTTTFKVDFNVLKTCAEGEESKTLCLENKKRIPESKDAIAFKINDVNSFDYSIFISHLNVSIL